MTKTKKTTKKAKPKTQYNPEAVSTRMTQLLTEMLKDDGYGLTAAQRAEAVEYLSDNFEVTIFNVLGGLILTTLGEIEEDEEYEQDPEATAEEEEEDEEFADLEEEDDEDDD